MFIQMHCDVIKIKSNIMMHFFLAANGEIRPLNPNLTQSYQKNIIQLEMSLIMKEFSLEMKSS